MVPNDPLILVSYINMKLRDGCISLQEFCDENGLDRNELEEKHSAAGFEFDENADCFR